MKTELLQKVPDLLRSALEQEWQRLEAKNKCLERENKILREQILLARIEKYGAKSEKLSDGQALLLDVEPGVLAAEVEAEAQCSEEEKTAVERQRKPRPHPGRSELPADLPRHDLIIACAPEDCRCQQCGEEKKLIGYEQSEELDVVPAVYSVKVIKREKRACGRCEEMGVVTDAAPLKVIEKCKASNRMIVEVIISKYCNHQPIYRQCVSLERDANVELNRTTLCGWVLQTGSLMEALSRSMRENLLVGGYVQADETPVGVQSERTKGSNHRAYLWEYSRPGGPVVFDFQMGRSREGPKNFLGKYAGVLQTDGYRSLAFMSTNHEASVPLCSSA